MDSLLAAITSQATAKADPDAPWWLKWVAGLLLLVGLWWVRRQMEQQRKELAYARTQAEMQRYEALRVEALAKSAGGQHIRQKLEQQAQEALAASERKLDEIQEAQDAHAERQQRIRVIESGDWEALNALAGIES